MMNVFIDTNILFEKYFFDEKSVKRLLDYAQRGLLNLYMSEVVRLELRRQYQNELEASNGCLKKIEQNSEKMKYSIELNKIDVEQQLAIFDMFYDLLNKGHGNFSILPYKNEMLPEIVERAVSRRKPFTENKTELKDAIIWLTYAQYAEENDLKDCILLSNNTDDFCTKKDKTTLHPELQKDSKRFSVINSAFEFIRTQSPIIEKPLKEFENFVASLSIDNEYILTVIQEYFEKEVEKKLRQDIERTSLDHFLPDYIGILDGEMVPTDIEIAECRNIDYEVLDKRALVSGIVTVTCTSDYLEYHPGHEPGEDNFVWKADKFLIFDMYFNFDLLEDEKFEDFEITDIKLESVN